MNEQTTAEKIEHLIQDAPDEFSKGIRWGTRYCLKEEGRSEEHILKVLEEIAFRGIRSNPKQ